MSQEVATSFDLVCSRIQWRLYTGLDRKATESILLATDIYKVSLSEDGGGDRFLVYKVYDYHNRSGIAEEYRWTNIDLVWEFYPRQGGIEPKEIVSTKKLEIFSCLYVEGEKLEKAICRKRRSNLSKRERR